MSVDKFCGEAYCIGSNRRQAFLVHFSCACRGNLDLKSQCLPESSPERHGFPESEDSRDANSNISLNFRFRIRVFFHQKFFTEDIKIRHFLQSLSFLPDLGLYLFILWISQHLSPLTAVIGDPGITIRETYDSPFAMVGAERTGGIGFLCIGKVIHSLKTDESLLFRLAKSFFRDQGSSNSSHDPRIRGPYHIFPQILLHGSKHCVILESSSLDYDLISQTVQIRNTDNFGKHIFNNGPAKSCHNIPRQFTVSLLCNNTAVHKNRTPASQFRRIF